MSNIKPPLPFVGHKGHWFSELSDIASKLPENITVFDVFGGSGCCSEIFKRSRPDLCVVWNDYDNYRARLSNVSKTDNLRRFFLDKLGAPVKKGAFIPPLSEDERQFVFESVRSQLAQFGFVDLQTVSRWFYLYSQKTYKLMSYTGKLYNRVPVSPIRLSACENWLSGCVRNCVCFSGLDTVFTVNGCTVRPSDFIDNQNALFIFDPPYLGTGNNDYGNQEALLVLRSISECCERLPFLLFGDSSIAFWYEALFRGRRLLKFEKTINNIGMQHNRRTEVLFACLPE